MDVTFATTDVHPRDRLDYWREVACRAFVDLECDTPRRRAFRAKIRSGPFADLGLSVVESDPCEVRRTPQGIARSSGDAVLLSVQMAGSSVLTQDGRQAPLGPGDFALYDTRRPYTLDVHAGTAQLVLKIPRKALEARLGSTAAYTARALAAGRPLTGLAAEFLKGLASRAGAMEPWCERTMAEQALDLVALAVSQDLRAGNLHLSSAGSRGAPQPQGGDREPVVRSFARADAGRSSGELQRPSRQRVARARGHVAGALHLEPALGKMPSGVGSPGASSPDDRRYCVCLGLLQRIALLAPLQGGVRRNADRVSRAPALRVRGRTRSEAASRLAPDQSLVIGRTEPLWFGPRWGNTACRSQPSFRTRRYRPSC